MTIRKIMRQSGVRWLIDPSARHTGFSSIIKSPFQTPPLPPPAAYFVHAITFEQLFGFLTFWHNCLPWPINDLIWFWSIFVVTLTLNFQGQIWNLLYLSQKWSDCQETKSKHIDWTQCLNVTIRDDLGHDLDLGFQVKYGICHISVKNSLIATKRKANISIEI